ncbi:MAG: hypothetical protein JSV38_01390 [Desulfobacterales bacterium]|nr:MAG: hypothetical protein JSV38_01390 [Desulfobacterales bacterium]
MDDVLIKGTQLGSIFDYLSIGTVISSSDRKIVLLNRTAEFITGQRQADVVGKPCTEMFLNNLCGGECALDKTIRESYNSAALDIILTDQSNEELSVT